MLGMGEGTREQNEVSVRAQPCSFPAWKPLGEQGGGWEVPFSRHPHLSSRTVFCPSVGSGDRLKWLKAEARLAEPGTLQAEEKWTWPARQGPHLVPLAIRAFLKGRPPPRSPLPAPTSLSVVISSPGLSSHERKPLRTRVLSLWFCLFCWKDAGPQTLARQGQGASWSCRRERGEAAR